MNRREFLRAVIAVPLSAAAVPLVPAMVAVDRETGITMQFIREWEHQKGLRFHRDCFVMVFPPLEIDPKYEIRYGRGTFNGTT